MANVKFLRGVQSGLPTGSSIIDGALYFTTDTKRLFLGNGTGASAALLPIAEGITTVTSAASLPVASQHNGEFYYITSDNILAWSNGSTWLQTNINTQLDANNSVLSVSNGTVSFSAQDTAHNEISGSFTIAAGSQNVTIGQGANGELTISVADPITYELKSEGGASSNTNDDIAIVLDPSSGSDQKVAFKNSTSVDVIRDQSTGAISFAVNQGGISGVASAHVFPYTENNTTHPASSNNGFELKLVTGDGTELGNIFDPLITYGASGNQTVHFVNGTATLNVPTNSEVNAAIENLQKTINAMIYRGTASNATTITGSTLHNGDVWLANDEFTLGSETVKPGYLVVVQGTEGTDGTIPAANATYSVVKGNDTDTTYSGTATTHGVRIDDSNNNEGVAAFQLDEGTSISLSDTAIQGGTKVTISHANVSRSDPAKDTTTGTQSAGTNLVFDVVTGVTTNSQGHVTAVATKQITVVDTQLDAGSWSTTSSVATSSGTETATITQSNSGDLGTMNFKLASSSLDLAASGDTVSIDLVWGTFGSGS